MNTQVKEHKKYIEELSKILSMPNQSSIPFKDFIIMI